MRTSIQTKPASIVLAVAITVLAACGSTPVPPPSASAHAAPTAATSPTGTPTAAATRTGLTREAAIALAKEVMPEGSPNAVLAADAGPFKDYGGYGPTKGRTPAPDDWVWSVNLGEYGGPTGGSGTIVVLDYYDGHLVQTYDWVG